MKNKKKEMIYILYDERALTGDTFQASVFCTEDNLKDVKESSKLFVGVWYVGELVNDELKNEKFYMTTEQVNKLK